MQVLSSFITTFFRIWSSHLFQFRQYPSATSHWDPFFLYPFSCQFLFWFVQFSHRIQITPFVSLTLTYQYRPFYLQVVYFNHFWIFQFQSWIFLIHFLQLFFLVDHNTDQVVVFPYQIYWLVLFRNHAFFACYPPQPFRSLYLLLFWARP